MNKFLTTPIFNYISFYIAGAIATLSLPPFSIFPLIIGIGFVAIFQMVQYSVRSIDVSGERTKSNLLISMVAEDLISEKTQLLPQVKYLLLII